MISTQTILIFTICYSIAILSIGFTIAYYYRKYMDELLNNKIKIK